MNKFTVLTSVFEKEGLTKLLLGMRMIAPTELEIISTGGTLKHLVSAGLEVVPIEKYTGVPEGMDGRVKTINHRTAAGLLRKGAQHDEFLAMVGAQRIHMYIGNLYPFEAVAANAASTHEEIIENIDIGGPGNWRALAKNYVNGIVVSHPDQYEMLLTHFQKAQQLRVEAIPLGVREDLAYEVFRATSEYDLAISEYLAERKTMRVEE